MSSAAAADARARPRPRTARRSASAAARAGRAGARSPRRRPSRARPPPPSGARCRSARVRAPAALVDSMPPSVAQRPLDGSGGSRSPARSAAMFSSASVTLALARARRAGPSTVSRRGSAVRSTTTSVAHVAAAHGAARAAGHQRDAMRRRPVRERREILAVLRHAHRGGEDPEDPGALGVGGTCTMVGSVEAPDRRGRQHAEKVITLSPMSDTPRAQLIHIDVDRRLGHEWDEWDGKPLPNSGNYDSAPIAVLRLVRDGARGRARSRVARAVSARPPSRPAPPHAAPAPLDRARCRERGALALVGGALPLLCDAARAPARTARRARAVPPAHAAHLARGRPVRPARLGRERVGQGLQRAGPAPAAEGRQGRAAAPDPALPVEGDAGRGTRHRGEVRGAGVRGHPRASSRGGSSASAGRARSSRWPASGTW